LPDGIDIHFIANAFAPEFVPARDWRIAWFASILRGQKRIGR
jgi:hypothetical protein